VPLDPGYPPNRVSMLLEDSAAPVVVTHSSVAKNSPVGLADHLSSMPRKPTMLSIPSFLHATRSILRTWPTLSSHRVSSGPAQRRANYARELAEPSALAPACL